MLRKERDVGHKKRQWSSPQEAHLHVHPPSDVCVQYESNPPYASNPPYDPK